MKNFLLYSLHQNQGSYRSLWTSREMCGELLQCKMQDRRFAWAGHVSRSQLHHWNHRNRHWETSGRRLQDFLFDAYLWRFGQLFNTFCTVHIKYVIRPSHIRNSAEIYILALTQNWFQYGIIDIISRTIWTLWLSWLLVYLWASRYMKRMTALAASVLVCSIYLLLSKCSSLKESTQSPPKTLFFLALCHRREILWFLRTTSLCIAIRFYPRLDHVSASFSWKQQTYHVLILFYMVFWRPWYDV